MDFGSIAAAVTSLKAAGDIASGLISIKTTAEVQSKAVELNQKILAAQYSIFEANAAQSALIQQVANLEKQIAQMSAWEEQKKRYKLAEPWGASALVYGVKTECKGSEEPHWICTKCYDDGRRSILNPSKDSKYFVIMVCPTCKAQIHTGMHGIGSPTYV
jgi:hypothetical protein